MFGASGTPGFNFTIRKRRMPSVIRSDRSSAPSNSGVPAWNWSRWYSASVFLSIGYVNVAISPFVMAQELTPRLNRSAGVRDDLRSRRLLGLRVQQQHEVVCGCGQGHTDRSRQD